MNKIKNRHTQITLFSVIYILVFAKHKNGLILYGIIIDININIY